MAQARKVAILGGARIPFARSNTAYSTQSNQAMLTASLKGLVDKYQLHGEMLGEVAAGAVLKHSRDRRRERWDHLTLDFLDGLDTFGD